MNILYIYKYTSQKVIFKNLVLVAYNRTYETRPVNLQASKVLCLFDVY